MATPGKVVVEVGHCELRVFGLSNENRNGNPGGAPDSMLQEAIHVLETLLKIRQAKRDGFLVEGVREQGRR